MQPPRTFQSRHADEREEEELESRSEYSDEYILRSFGAHRGPKLDLSEEQCDHDSCGDWLAVKNAATDWLTVSIGLGSSPRLGLLYVPCPGPELF